MNLSCLFGHSYSEKSKGILLVINNAIGIYRYTKYKIEGEKCVVCDKIKYVRLEEYSGRGDSFYNVNITNNQNLLIKVVDKSQLNRFIEDYNDINRTNFEKKDFLYV